MKKGQFFGLNPVMLAVVVGVILLTFGLLVGGAGVPGGGGGGAGGVGVARDFTCDVTVGEKFLGGAVVEGVDCTVTKIRNSCGFFSLGIFTESGKVKVLDSSGVIASKDFKTPFFGAGGGSTTVSLSDCTLDNAVVVRVVDDDGNLVDSRVVSLV